MTKICVSTEICGKPALKEVVDDALRHTNEEVLGCEYFLGCANGRVFKLVVEPEGVASFDSSVVGENDLGYQIIFEK